MKPYDLEAIYDEQIAPLMTQIIVICKEHSLPMIASFAFRCEHGEYDLCSTAILDRDGEKLADFVRAINAIYAPGSEI